MRPIPRAVPDRMRQLLQMPLIRWTYRAVMTRFRRLRETQAGILRDECCGMNLNWRPAARSSAHMAAVHWCHTRILWRKNRTRALLTTLLWPVVSPIFILRRVARHGRHVAQQFGVPLSRQVRDLVYLAHVLYMGPRTYYYYGLYHPGRTASASLYVQDHEILGLLDGINRDTDHRIFENKTAFFEKCRQSGLRTIPIAARFENGKAAFIDDGGRDADWFAKPEGGRCGTGIMAFRYDGPGRYRSESGRRLSKEDVMARVAACSLSSPYILQERILNHADVAALVGDALSTCRIVTYREPDGSEGVLPCAIFKMAARGRSTDNFHTGGMAVSIDLETGVLGRGVVGAEPTTRWDVHPDTQKRVNGFQLPFWAETLALCREAHRVFKDYAFIGWDVAITDDGPMLVEGNLFWGVEAMQMAHETPLGETPFPRVYLAHMKRQRG
ncbi:sugar-transfer associated ATP-grasp domain-containing protein [Desulfococcus sp.]|uniref:sugar-transfer associated ATP-grasp domain-containing protein n=1 Tax=Desulfococcus sp. TaxID=2025834 RepID=UPI003D0F5FAA